MTNPRLGGAYPYITQWRCPKCLHSWRIANAGEREWCLAYDMTCLEPLRLLSPRLAVPVEEY